MRYFGRLLLYLAIFFVTLSVSSVLIARFIPITVTPLKVIRLIENFPDKGLSIQSNWCSLAHINPVMPCAVIATEDNNFMVHNGFDWEAIKKAYNENREGDRLRGGSTISQQTAKNVFCLPSRTWVRKGFEAYYTLLIETFWSKRRIMEVYLNSIEMGSSIYGLDACAEYNFGKTASELTRSECALIAATLPNPRKFSSKYPSAYMRKRQSRIKHEMRYIPSFPKEGEDYNPQTSSGGIYSTK